MQLVLSEGANAFYALMRDEYIGHGYARSGAVDEAYAAAGCGFSSSAFHDALVELQDAGLIQRQHCAANRWKLSILVCYHLIVAHQLASTWRQATSSLSSDPSGGEVMRVTDEAAQLCLELARKLVQARTSRAPDSGRREAVSLVFPLDEQRVHRLYGPTEMRETADHILESLHAYTASKLLGMLRHTPLDAFAEAAATHFISAVQIGPAPLSGWHTARWAVVCLFAPRGTQIDPPCIVCEASVTQDPTGSKTRAEAEKWRGYVADAIRSGLKETLPQRPR